MRGLRWLAPITATALVVVTAALWGDGTGAVVFGAVQVMGFAATGAFLIGRLPANPIGWLLCWYGINFALGFSADNAAGAAYATGHDALAAWLGWYESWSFLLGLPLVLALLPLWFPDGRPPSARWRWVVPLAIGGAVLAAIGQATRPDAMLIDLANPVGQRVPLSLSQAALAVGSVMLTAAVVGGVASLVARGRRATGAERQQIKWFAAGVGAAAVVFAVLAPVAVTTDSTVVSDAALVAITTAMLAIPTTVAVAILRYRLYDIDRLVSRTVAYGLVTAVLLGLYALVAVVPAAIFDLDSDLLVAAATLAAAAAFGPVRRHVQTVVDRRFHRSRYDATRTVEAFGRRLEQQTQVDAVGADLVGVTARTLHPSSISLWLSERP